MPDGQIGVQYNPDKSGTSIKRTEKDAAMGKTCLQHPWRSAYAVCAYCNRPFCFEDILEYGSHYYCVNDIERVARPQEEKRHTGYKLYLFSGIMLILAFLVFTYSEYGAFINTFSILFGGTQAITTVIYVHLQMIVGGILMLALLADAIMILMQSRGSVYAGIALSIISVALFSYLLLNGNGAIAYSYAYVGFIDAVSFVSLVVLTYIGIKNDRAKEVPLPHKETVEDRLLRWPDSGRF